MKHIPFLNWMERWALRVLVRSQNVGMVAVKQMDGPLLFIANAPYDEAPMDGPSAIADHLERIYQNSYTDEAYQGPD